MNYTLNYDKPHRIICLTEESVETLFEIGAGEQIVGVSSFVKRPIEATSLPKVSLFTSSNIKKILEKKPDLVLGFSDIQKDIAKELIGEGVDVWIANHRTLEETFRYIKTLSLMVDRKSEGENLLKRLKEKIDQAIEFSKTLSSKPKVYFEEWDDPLISAITWVHELIELVGGENIFSNKAYASLAKDRFVTHEEIIKKNPDIIIACHCGKKVKIDSIKQRDEYSNVNAVRDNFVLEVEPEIFLQPGPAPILAGIDILIDIMKQWNEKNNGVEE